jgi:hypothetical protein
LEALKARRLVNDLIHAPGAVATTVSEGGEFVPNLYPGVDPTVTAQSVAGIGADFEVDEQLAADRWQNVPEGY